MTAMTETFIKERKHTLTGKVEPDDVTDAVLKSARTRQWEKVSLGACPSL